MFRVLPVSSKKWSWNSIQRAMQHIFSRLSPPQHSDCARPSFISSRLLCSVSVFICPPSAVSLAIIRRETASARANRYIHAHSRRTKTPDGIGRSCFWCILCDVHVAAGGSAGDYGERNVGARGCFTRVLNMWTLSMIICLAIIWSMYECLEF